MSQHVTVIESYDGFTLKVEEFHKYGIVSVRLFHFDQEDSVESLVDVFEELGIDSSYEEDY